MATKQILNSSTAPDGSQYVTLTDGAGNLVTVGGGGGSGTVTSVSVVTNNGVSGSVATATTTPAITLTLGAITPTSIVLPATGGATTTLVNFGTAGTGMYGSSTQILFAAGGVATVFIQGLQLGFISTSAVISMGANAFLTSGAAATWKLGNADAAAPIAQNFKVQGVSAGNSNTAGVAFNISGSVSTGTGLGGSIILNTSPAGTTGTTVNAGTVGVTLDGNKNFVLNNAAIATNATDGFLYIPTCAGTPTGTPTTFTGRVPMVFDTTNSQFWFFTGGAWKQPKTPAGAAVVTWQ